MVQGQPALLMSSEYVGPGSSLWPFGIWHTEFQVMLNHIVAVGAWAIYLVSLNLCFLTYKGAGDNTYLTKLVKMQTQYLLKCSLSSQTLRVQSGWEGGLSAPYCISPPSYG